MPTRTRPSGAASNSSRIPSSRAIATQCRRVRTFPPTKDGARCAGTSACPTGADIIGVAGSCVAIGGRPRPSRLSDPGGGPCSVDVRFCKAAAAAGTSTADRTSANAWSRRQPVSTCLIDYCPEIPVFDPTVRTRPQARLHDRLCPGPQRHDHLSQLAEDRTPDARSRHAARFPRHETPFRPVSGP